MLKSIIVSLAFILIVSFVCNLLFRRAEVK